MNGLISLYLLLSVSAAVFSYELGKTYSYEYLTRVSLNESPDASQQHRKDVRYEVKAEVQLTPLWQNPSHTTDQVLSLQIKNPKLSIIPKDAVSNSPNQRLDEDPYFKEHTSVLDLIKTGTFALHLTDGKVNKIYVQQGNTSALLRSLNNMAKGVASLLQFQGSSSGEKVEVDASGQCDVQYIVTADNVIKQKRNCVPYLSSPSGGQGVLGTNVESEYEITYRISSKHNIIDSANSFEVHNVRLNLRKASGARIESIQKLNLVSFQDSKSDFRDDDSASTAIRHYLKAVKEPLEGQDLYLQREILSEPKDYTQALKELRDNLTSETTAVLSQAQAVIELARGFQTAPPEKLVKELKDPKNKKILAQLLDVAAAAQAPPLATITSEVLNFKSDSGNLDLQERYLTAVSVLPNPSEETVAGLLSVIRSRIASKKLQQTSLNTLGSLLRQFRKHPANLELKVSKDVERFLIEKLEKCDGEPCRLRYLRALRNAASSTSTPVLLKVLKTGGKKSVNEALKALSTLPTSAFADNVKSALRSVYHRPEKSRHDSTSRVIAAELLLLNSPDRRTILDIVASLGEKELQEVASYVNSHILELSQKCPKFRSVLKEVLSHSKVGNYHSLSPGGSSTAFTHKLFETGDLNGTYGVHMEMIGGGLLKRSAFDVHVSGLSDQLFVLSFGLFAGGLESFVGDSNDEGSESADAEEPTAGIELGILGTALRSYVLFKGQSELMSHVWSGSAEQPQTIFEGNLVLQDERQLVPLQNGLTIDVSTVGLLSLIMTGQMSISLWYRTSHTIIQDRAAVLIQTTSRIESNFIHSHVTSIIAGEGQMQFITDLAFAESPFKMCIQMLQDPSTLKFVVRKLEKIPNSKHFLKRTRRTATTVPPRSYLLNRKNSELCKVMLTE